MIVVNYSRVCVICCIVSAGLPCVWCVPIAGIRSAVLVLSYICMAVDVPRLCVVCAGIAPAVRSVWFLFAYRLACCSLFLPRLVINSGIFAGK